MLQGFYYSQAPAKSSYRLGKGIILKILKVLSILHVFTTTAKNKQQNIGVAVYILCLVPDGFARADRLLRVFLLPLPPSPSKPSLKYFFFRKLRIYGICVFRVSQKRVQIELRWSLEHAGRIG